MGLDITMAVTGNEVLDRFCEDDAYARFDDLKPHFAEFADQAVHTRPGSYHGIHLVRNMWAKFKGYSDDYLAEVMGGVKPDHPCRASHLCWHSDADGWYVPQAFDPPLMDNRQASIGSSVGLLKELEEIRSMEMNERERDAYLAILIPAVASVICNEPIKFC